jgi:gamma-glutamylcyclotransferase (GGCT)/AIG2-like uncharacterized protein YtfP
MSEVCPLLFVYGTLRRDSAHPMARYLETVARFLGNATTAGRLYDLGPYPGLVVAPEPGERVHGHLFEMADPKQVLARLDAYEGRPLGEPGPSYFERRLADVMGEDGQLLTAWTYAYIGPLSSAVKIGGGFYQKKVRPELLDL